jgi:nucleotide-binding universal stress UspA family protein
VILLCYDGSEDAQAAADRATKLFPGAPVTVLTVWERYVEMLTQNGFGLGYAPPISDVEEIDAAWEEQAGATAQQGVERLRHGGMTAVPRVEARRASIAATILAVADEIKADAIVLGTRGRGGIKSALLGSVSHAVLQHAARPVVVVPSETVARTRTGAQDLMAT